MKIIKFACLGLLIFLFTGCHSEPEQDPVYTYGECFDNDNADFNQMEAREVFFEQLEISKGEYSFCEATAMGEKDIIGCIGDSFYSYECFDNEQPK